MIGTLLDQRYQVVQVLGQGGFGHTYVAEDTRRPGNPTCVVKHLKPAASEPDFLQTARRLFNSEAETLEKLGTHDQIPRLLAYFEENQEFYLVEEFIPGHPLSAELQPGQRWTESQVIELLQEVLSILEFVHSNGVIHRDLKPDNLIRRQQDNKLVLVDFGAVKQVKMQSAIAQDATNQTVAIGTPGYMPSEQGQGRPRPSSDIYALGMIGIQAVTGLSPRHLSEDAETGEVIWQQYAQASDGLVEILTQMVRHYFKYRYQSATEALQALSLLTNPYTPTALLSVFKQKVRGYLRDSHWSGMRSRQTNSDQSTSKTLGINESYVRSDDATTPLVNSIQNTVTVAPANRSQLPNRSLSSQPSISPTSSKLPLLVGTGIAMGGIAIAIFVTRLPFLFPASHQNKTEITVNKPQPEVPSTQPKSQPQNTCIVVTSPSNVRSVSGRQKTGKVIKAGTKVTVTGKEEGGWIEISAPESGWIWKSRTKNTCPPEKN